MNFKKLALASAIATLPMGAFALDEITDEAMAEVSGQDGIAMTLNIAAAGISTSIWLHDKDGLSAVATPTSYSYDGAIVIENMQIAVGGANIVISVDAGDRGTSGTAPILQVNVALPATLTISTGAIRVANSQRDNAGPNNWSIDSQTATILNNMTIILGGTTLNIQLGNEQQVGSIGGTDMMVLNASVTGGLVVSGFRLSDATAGAGGIGATTMTVIDSGGGANLTLAVDVNATNLGLELGLGVVGNAATGMDIRIVDQYLGTSTNPKIGDVTIVGLNLNGSTLTINGK